MVLTDCRCKRYTPTLGTPGFWIFGDHQSKGDDATGIPWPGAN